MKCLTHFSGFAIALFVVLQTSEIWAQSEWRILGTNGNDELIVGATVFDPGLLYAEVNGKISGYRNATSVSRIRIDGLGGDDYIEIDESSAANNILTLLIGGYGDDEIHGSYARDFIYGGPGNDQLFGKAGNDMIYGEAGDDTLDGGSGGSEKLDGGPGKNEIVNTFWIRVPAEWEWQENVWMQWPKGEEISYRSNFAGIIKILQGFEPVNLIVNSGAMQAEATAYLLSQGVPINNIKFHRMQYDWSWLRDNGPIWVEHFRTDGSKKLVAQDWGFNGWGGVGGPSRKDDVVPPQLAKIENAEVEPIGIITERGTFEFNGINTLITSWPVLHDRNPDKTRGQLERELKNSLGVSKVIWLESFSPYDVTKGHVDGIARFVGPNTVAVGRFEDQSDPSARLFEESAQIIQAAGLNVIRVNIPGYVRYRGEEMEANYMNYLVANGVIIVPGFGVAAWDNAAAAEIQAIYPELEVRVTDLRELWYNGGSVHCVTNDKPFFLK